MIEGVGQWQRIIDYTMEAIFPELRAVIFRELFENSNPLERLSKQKLYLEQHDNIRPSRVSLCTGLLLVDVYGRYSKEARSSVGRNDFAAFRFLNDFALGAGHVLTQVVSAEDELSDLGEEKRLAVVNDLSRKDNLSEVESIEMYLKMQREALACLEILKRDPSGFELMDTIVERIEASPPAVQEYVLAGAKLARDLYKELFKIAAPLYPQELP